MPINHAPRDQQIFSEAELDEFEANPDKFFESRNYIHQMREDGFARTQQGSDSQKENVRIALDFLHKNISDKTLQQKLTPDYEFGCKRIYVQTITYSPDNVSLISMLWLKLQKWRNHKYRRCHRRRCNCFWNRIR